jgi:hypothetical protein
VTALEGVRGVAARQAEQRQLRTSAKASARVRAKAAAPTRLAARVVVHPLRDVVHLARRRRACASASAQRRACETRQQDQRSSMRHAPCTLRAVQRMAHRRTRPAMEIQQLSRAACVASSSHVTTRARARSPPPAPMPRTRAQRYRMVSCCCGE